MKRSESLFFGDIQIKERSGLKTFRVLDGLAKDPSSGAISFYTRIVDLPLDISLEPNAREGHVDTPLSREIRRTLCEDGASFVLKNAGPVMTCASVNYDPRAKTLTGDFRAIDGMVDCGSTYRNLQKVYVSNQRTLELYRSNPKADPDKLAEAEAIRAELEAANVHVTIMPGLAPLRVREVSVARNSHNKVQDHSNLDSVGVFEPMKQALSEAVRNRVMFHENQLEVNGVERDTKVQQLVKLAFVLNKEKAGVNRHEVYGGRYLKDFEKNFKTPGYLNAVLLTEQGLRVYDTIVGEISSRIRLNGKDEPTLQGAERVESGYKLPYANKKATWKIPEAYVWPIVGSLRNLLNEKGDAFRVDPVKFVEDHGGELVSEFMAMYMSGDLPEDPTNFGKTPVVWTSLSLRVELIMAKKAA